MVRFFLVDAKYEGEIKFTEKLNDFLIEKKPKSIALFASVQFLELEELTRRINELGIEIKTTKADRALRDVQVLGCDCYSHSFKDPMIKESDMILYVGDGQFHPKALLLSQAGEANKTPVVIFNPVSDRVFELGYEEVEKQIERRKRNLRMFLSAEKIGIFVTLKSGQQYLALAETLKKKLKGQGKKAFIFIEGTLNFAEFENFPFVDCWVNSACPRIGTDDILNIEKPLINIRDAFDPVLALEELEG